MATHFCLHSKNPEVITSLMIELAVLLNNPINFSFFHSLFGIDFAIKMIHKMSEFDLDESIQFMSEFVLLILDLYFKEMKTSPSIFLEFMKYFYGIASKNLRKEEAFIASNIL
jgi:hypothetical protein